MKDNNSKMRQILEEAARSTTLDREAYINVRARSTSRTIGRGQLAGRLSNYSTALHGAHIPVSDSMIGRLRFMPCFHAPEYHRAVTQCCKKLSWRPVSLMCTIPRLALLHYCRTGRQLTRGTGAVTSAMMRQIVGRSIVCQTAGAHRHTPFDLGLVSVELLRPAPLESLHLWQLSQFIV